MPTKKQPESAPKAETPKVEKPKIETPKVVVKKEEVTTQLTVSKPNEPEQNPIPKKVGSFKTRKGNTITFN
tara:strand:+ start:383 stop:595 length:213 start_codon:yes stop_codon:yes gene_type:complete